MSIKSILISIKPEFMELIFSGEKTVELRKSVPKDLPNNTEIIFYASSPERKIVGKAKIKRVEELSIDQLWDELGDQTGITVEYFKEYFEGKDKGYGLILDKVEKFSEQFSLDQLRERFNFYPPQSYMYTSETISKALENVTNTPADTNRHQYNY